MIKVILIIILCILMFFMYCLVVAGKKSDEKLEQIFKADKEKDTNKTGNS